MLVRLVYEILTSDAPPALASQGAGITGVSHHAWPLSIFYILSLLFAELSLPLFLTFKLLFPNHCHPGSFNFLSCSSVPRIQMLLITLFLVSILSHPQNDRVATQLVVSIRVQGDKRLSSLRRCCALTRYDAHKMSHDAFTVIKNCNTSGIQTEW